MELVIHSMTNFTENQKNQYLTGVSYGIQCINSSRFERKVLDHSYLKRTWYGRKKRYKGFTYTKDSNLTVLRKFKSGEDTPKGPDKKINVIIEAYTSTKNVIGYTYPSFHKTWINTRYLKYPHVVAANMVHEYCHNLDYRHPRNRTSLRPHSVPYGVGDIVSDMIRYNEIILDENWSRYVTLIH